MIKIFQFRLSDDFFDLQLIIVSMSSSDEILPKLLANNEIIYFSDKSDGSIIFVGTTTFKLWYDSRDYMIIVNRIPKTDVTLSQFTTFMYCLMSGEDTIPLKTCWYDALKRRSYYLPEHAKRDSVEIELSPINLPKIFEMMNVRINYTKAQRVLNNTKLKRCATIFLQKVMRYEDDKYNKAYLHYCGGDGNDEFYCIESNKYFYGFELYT